MATRSKTAAVLTAMAVSIGVLHAKDDPIKIATIAPDRSIYVKALYEMGEACKVRSKGRITFKVFPGGDNTEKEMLINMRPAFNRLQAAQLSAITLGNLEDGFNVFGLPMFFESYAEADRVLEALRPELERRLEARGYKALSWAYVGWIRVFSTRPVRTVADLKKLKLYASTGDDRLMNWYRANGFLPVPVDPTSIVSSLKTGMIEAVPSPPVFAQVMDLHSTAPYVMDIGLAPLLGSTVMSLGRWKRLSVEDQQIILEEAGKAADRLRREIPSQESQALEVMTKRGLKVTAVDRAEWRRMAEQLGEAMRRDGTVPKDIYDIARRERDAVRAGK